MQILLTTGSAAAPCCVTIAPSRPAP